MIVSGNTPRCYIGPQYHITILGKLSRRKVDFYKKKNIYNLKNEVFFPHIYKNRVLLF